MSIWFCSDLLIPCVSVAWWRFAILVVNVLNGGWTGDIRGTLAECRDTGWGLVGSRNTFPWGTWEVNTCQDTAWSERRSWHCWWPIVPLSILSHLQLSSARSSCEVRQTHWPVHLMVSKGMFHDVSKETWLDILIHNVFLRELNNLKRQHVFGLDMIFC